MRAMAAATSPPACRSTCQSSRNSTAAGSLGAAVRDFLGPFGQVPHVVVVDQLHPRLPCGRPVYVAGRRSACDPRMSACGTLGRSVGDLGGLAAAAPDEPRSSRAGPWSRPPLRGDGDVVAREAANSTWCWASSTFSASRVLGELRHDVARSWTPRKRASAISSDAHHKVVATSSCGTPDQDGTTTTPPRTDRREACDDGRRRTHGAAPSV